MGNCLCPISNTNFDVLYLTLCLVICLIVSSVLDGPWMCLDVCCEDGVCRDFCDFIVILTKFGGGYLFCAFLFLLRSKELKERWDAFEENNLLYIDHITFSDVFFILFCVATLLWIVFSVRKWCKRKSIQVEDNDNMEVVALNAQQSDLHDL